jgi:hypothetical protein
MSAGTKRWETSGIQDVQQLLQNLAETRIFGRKRTSSTAHKHYDCLADLKQRGRMRSKRGLHKMP